MYAVSRCASLKDTSSTLQGGDTIQYDSQNGGWPRLWPAGSRLFKAFHLGSCQSLCHPIIIQVNTRIPSGALMLCHAHLRLLYKLSPPMACAP